MSKRRPLILITNDDGISSPGLSAAAEAVHDLGDLLIAAPNRQCSGAGRSLPATSSGVIQPVPLPVAGRELTAYSLDGTPAQVVLHALLELSPRRPDLLVVGINFGENLGTDITISGTVGAALQGAAMGVPALAVSLQTPKETHTNPTDDVDFTAAKHFTRLVARRMLSVDLPFDVDVIKVDVPDTATPATAWRLTRLSRHVYFRPIPPQRDDWTQPTVVDYRAQWDLEVLERDSDIYALAVDRVVAVTPLSLDLTSRADAGELEALLRGMSEL